MISFPASRCRRMLTFAVALFTAVAMIGAAPAVAEAVTTSGAPAHTAAASTRSTHTVSYDQYSFMVDGKRTYLWAGEFHYFRLPSPDLWRDVLQKMKAAGFNATSLYFDWAYHSPKPGVYDFSGVRDVDRLLTIASQVGIYVIARPGPYINAEVDSGGFPGWLTMQHGRARSNAADYLAAGDEWLSHIDPIIARHQLTNGTGTVITYQVENEFYDGSAQAREYMAHLNAKARADGITVPLVGNHNGTYSAGVGAADIDMADSYPQGFNCSKPATWNGAGDLSWVRSAGKPLGIGEFQGGAFDPWGGPGYEKCRQLTGPDFERVFYEQNIATGFTQQSFYMTYGGTSWGWEPDPNQVYTSYDYGAAISEPRQLTTKYDEQKRIGYLTQAVAPLTKTDRLEVARPTTPAIVDTARINPDDHTQFHILRHADSTSNATDSTHIAIDLAAGSAPPVTYTYDDVDAPLDYQGTWTHADVTAGYTGADYLKTESFSSTTDDAVTVPFDGTTVRWLSGKDNNHGIANVYLDGQLVKTVDGYGSTKTSQEVFYEASGLTDGPHTLKIAVTGEKNPAASGSFVVVDAIDLRPAPAPAAATYPSVPQEPGTALTFAGRDSKILVANYALGAQHLQYSTSEIMTHATIADRDVALLYGRAGQDGETVLRYADQPTVTVLSGDVHSTWDATSGDLRLNYRHDGLARVLVTGGARPLLLLLATDEVAATFWRQETTSGTVLVRGPQLLRTAKDSGTTLALTGDTSTAGDLEVFAGATAITFNGRPVATQATPSGSLSGSLTGPQPVSLPALTSWKYSTESPESEPGFDDSHWRIADHTTSPSVTAPATMPVLFVDDYGFHYGDVWYRGRFKGADGETGVNLTALTGRSGAYSAWLNGVFLGSSTNPQVSLAFPAGALRTGAENVLSVLVENMGHNEDYNSADSHKEARGLTGARLIGAPFASIGWRIQGARGGEELFDPTRGPTNNGGLFGERTGWSLPGFGDSDWASVSLPHPDTRPGVSWYRTQARLDLPRGQDTSVGLRIDDVVPAGYRAQIFVNGWLLGRYLSNVGPQHSFPIPNGILNPNGANTIAIAVWNTDATSGGLGTVSLESYGTQRSPLHVATVTSPGFDADRYALPAAPQASVSLDAPGTIKPGTPFTVLAAASVPADAPTATDVSTVLDAPAGWTVTAVSPTTTPELPAEATMTMAWRVTPPADTPAGGSVLVATTSYTQQGQAGAVSDSRPTVVLPAAPSKDTDVSALPFLSASNGWGPVERNTSNGEQGAGDGGPISVDGTEYDTGLGVHAAGDVGLYLGGRCTRLTAVAGIDDEVGALGSVTFSVIADGRTVFTSDTRTGSSPALPVDVDITGAQVLDLVLDTTADGAGSDHADWADAKVHCR